MSSKAPAKQGMMATGRMQVKIGRLLACSRAAGAQAKQHAKKMFDK